MKLNKLFSLAFLIFVSACTSSNKEEARPVTAPAAPVTAIGKTVTLKGTVTAKGKGTAPENIRMSADPYCAKYWQGKKIESKKVEVSAGDGLKGAVVYLKNPPKTSVPCTTRVVLDQKGCVYEPTVLALQVGQPLVIKNSDSTLHNVHALPKTNSEFNFGMPSAGATTEKKFSKPEMSIRFKCDVHGWMSASISVFDHPYFAVTDANGNFEIAGVPEGPFTLEAFHPVLGTKEASTSSATFQY